MSKHEETARGIVSRHGILNADGVAVSVNAQSLFESFTAALHAVEDETLAPIIAARMWNDDGSYRGWNITALNKALETHDERWREHVEKVRAQVKPELMP